MMVDRTKVLNQNCSENRPPRVVRALFEAAEQKARKAFFYTALMAEPEKSSF